MILAPRSVAFDAVRSRDDELRGARGEIRFLVLPARRAVMVDGSGPPGPAAFAPRMSGLYSTAYGLRFALKARGVVTKVGPLEGLWWSVDGTAERDELPPDRPADWRWTLLIVLPGEATEDELATALAVGRGRVDETIAPHLRIEPFQEGRAAQVLYVGPNAGAGPTIEALHAAIAESGHRARGRHHEIYLGNPARGAPERLRTIIRQPIG